MTSYILPALETKLHQSFILPLTGRIPCLKVERDQLNLPRRLGGLGIINPTNQSKYAFETSARPASPLVALIISKSSIKQLTKSQVTIIIIIETIRFEK